MAGASPFAFRQTSRHETLQRQRVMSTSAGSRSSQGSAYSDPGDVLSEPVDVPASSSTVFPSSPLIQTPLSISTLSKVSNDVERPSTAASIWLTNAIPACGDPQVSMPKLPHAQNQALFSNALSNRTKFRSGSFSSCKSCQDARHPSHSYYPMDTPEAQLRFTRHLNKLLLCVWTEQQKEAPSPSSCSSRSSLSSARSSLYAADISLEQSSGDSLVSPLSSSRSTSCSVFSTASLADVDETCAYIQDADGFLSSPAPEYDVASPIRFSADLVYGSVSDGEDGETVVDMKEDSQTAQLGEAVLDGAGTPFPTNELKTPAAPRKANCHFYPPALDGQVAQPPRKRVRTRGSSELGQDPPAPSECLRIQGPPAYSPGRQSAYSQHSSSSRSKDPLSAATLVSAERKHSQSVSGEPAVPAGRSLSLVRLAREPASLRRAASLRSDPSTSDVAQVIPATTTRTTKSSPAASTQSREHLLLDCPPTQPVTPDSKNSAKRKSPDLSSVPVLSPGALSPVPFGRFSAVDCAEARIKALVCRELDSRSSDGLLAGTTFFTGDTVSGSSSDDIGRSPAELVPRDIVSMQDDVMQADEPGDAASNQHDETPLILGIEENFRIKAVEWILDVMPPAPSKHAKKKPFANLRAQLSESPDTRWHAAHLFTRYFLEIGTSTPPTPIPQSSSQEEGGRPILQGREALTWDVAVACLALSVKFHRDFLHPLYPVVATDYLAISPHTMEFDDLEAAHRDVLSALNFCIGSSTPGAYLEELLIALPSVRAFVDSRGDWEFAHAEAWEILFDTLVDVNYLRYPASAITGCALVLGIVESVVYKRKTEVALRARFAPQAALKRRRGLRCECDRLRAKASKAAEELAMDIRDVLGVSKGTWTKCMEWLKALEGY